MPKEFSPYLLDMAKSFGLSKPIVAESPQLGLYDHLLRCRALDREESVMSYIVLAPGDTEQKWEMIPESRVARNLLSQKWSKITSPGFYSTNYAELYPEADERFEKLIEECAVQDIIDYIDMCIDRTQLVLPSFNIMAAVVHFGELVTTSDGDIGLHYPHIHFLYKCVAKYPTDDEIELLQRV